jgi:hypothetical protein
MSQGIDRKRLLSVLFGVGSAIVVGLIGPIYATPILILSFALVFRKANRVSPDWLLAAFAISWFVVLVVSPPLIRNSPTDAVPIWIGFGILALALAGALALLSRTRST